MPMDNDLDSKERTAGELILFALAFIGFIIAVSGVIVATPSIAILGSVVMLLSLMGYFVG